MADNKRKSLHLKWAYFRHSIVSPILSSPPDRGELQKELAWAYSPDTFGPDYTTN